jgi:photosystem II stability/assembly factor-like uncharacterized protein
VHFVDVQVGWVVGEEGTILKTNDGGVNWTPQVSGAPWAHESVHFVNEKVGWIVGKNGTLLKTVDGGGS